MVITGVRVCDAGGEREADVRIEGGVIAEVGPNLSGEPRVSGNGAYLLPGLIDTNVRLKDAGLSGKNLEAISRSALRGGVTTVILSPDSNPPIDNAIALEFVQSNNASLEGAEIEANISAINAEGVLSNIAILLKKGALAPSMRTDIDANLTCRIAEYATMYGKTLCVKAEDASLNANGLMVEGEVATRMGLGGISQLGEILHVAKMIEVARQFHAKVLFKSIASPRSIELISQARTEGLEVFCEVAIQHLTCSDHACEGFNTAAKIDPPLPQEADVERLRLALVEGKIDMLTSLHQPNSPVNKEVAFADAASGSEAIEEAMSLYYTKLVKPGLIDMTRLVQLCSENPAKSISRRSGYIEPGAQADLVLFNPDASMRVCNPQSLFDGERLEGRVEGVVKHGRLTRFEG